MPDNPTIRDTILNGLGVSHAVVRFATSTGLTTVLACTAAGAFNVPTDAATYEAYSGKGKMTGSTDNPVYVTEGYTVLDLIGVSAYNFPQRVRPNEPGRKQLIIRNIGSVPVQLGYNSTADNSAYNGPDAYTITLNPGQEYVEDQSSTRQIFVRPVTSGQTGRIGVYHKQGAA